MFALDVPFTIFLESEVWGHPVGSAKRRHLSKNLVILLLLKFEEPTCKLGWFWTTEVLDDFGWSTASVVVFYYTSLHDLHMTDPIQQEPKELICILFWPWSIPWKISSGFTWIRSAIQGVSVGGAPRCECYTSRGQEFTSGPLVFEVKWFVVHFHWIDRGEIIVNLRVMARDHKVSLEPIV